MQLTKSRTLRELFVMAVTLLALYHAVRAIWNTAERQILLHRQSALLKAGHKQAQAVNKELKEGLSSYRSSAGIERLARERLNLAGQGEVIVRISK